MTMHTPLSIRLSLWIWLIIALYAGQQLWLVRLPAPAIPGLIFFLTATLLAAGHFLPLLRRWLEAVDLRALVLLHVTRFVGIYFLLLHERGELPTAFALPGGWGDIVVASLVLPVCFLPLSESTRRRAISIWNVIGGVDLLLVVFTAARLGWEDMNQMRALTYLPLSLLPTFLVPLLLASHAIIFLRLRQPSPTTA